jgi:CRP-like cAMP-binding protein
VPDAISTFVDAPALAELDPAELELLAGVSREHAFVAGTRIVREGDRGARILAFFVITEGTVAVDVGGSVVRRCGPGETLGEIGLLEDVPRTATVTAETDVRCLGLSAWSFRTLLEEHPELRAKLAGVGEARRSQDA